MERIRTYLPRGKQEESDQKLILELMAAYPDAILLRSLKFAHLTASAMIFNKSRDRVLMIYHDIFQNWTMTGGHADGESDLLQLAEQEAKEETGIKELIRLSKDIASLEILPVAGHYKNAEYVPAHLHLNVTFAFEASEEEELKTKAGENSGVAWLDLTV